MVTSENVTFELNQTEYGISEVKTCTVSFDPKSYGIIQEYDDVEDLYQMPLSPTIIVLTTKKDTNQPAIKKIIQKDKLMGDLSLEYARKECVLHSQLDHDNVVKLYDYTESEKDFVLFMEYCNSANYFDEKIVEQLTPITNQDKLIQYSLDILTGLQYIHNQGIIHSDMKLQNLLVNKPTKEEKEAGELPIVKICDFGLSHIRQSKLDGRGLMEYKCGTTGYIAPEVQPQNSIIGPEIDTWAFGVMLYEMCCAYKPTALKSYRYGSGPIPYRDRDWKKINKHAKSLIESCLEVDPVKRISIDEALQHPFFDEE